MQWAIRIIIAIFTIAVSSIVIKKVVCRTKIVQKANGNNIKQSIGDVGNGNGGDNEDKAGDKRQ